MPNTSSTSQVKAKPTFAIGDYAIHPTSGVMQIAKTESMNYGGQDYTVFLLRPYGRSDDNGAIRVPQAKILGTVSPMPTAEQIIECERLLKRRHESGPGPGSQSTKVYGMINSWDFLKMAEGVAKLRPCIKIYPPSSENALSAINTAIDRLALVTSLVTGEDRTAAVARLVTLSDTVPAPCPTRPPAKGAKDAKAVAADGVPADAPPSA